MTDDKRAREPEDAKPKREDSKPDPSPKRGKDDKRPPKGGYVFKFLPADPKDNLDFEDMADK